MNSARPTSYRPEPGRLLPADATTYCGPSLPWWFALAYLALIVARSLVHLFAFDGGAQSIATIDTDVAGGDNIVGLFGQWGAVQLLLAGLLLLLVVRYRGLLPLVLATILVEPFLRELAGALKPIETQGTAPGAALNLAAVPLLAIALWLSLCPASPRGADEPGSDR